MIADFVLTIVPCPLFYFKECTLVGIFTRNKIAAVLFGVISSMIIGFSTCIIIPVKLA